MKKIITFFTLGLLVLMCSCSNSSSNIDYLPCKVDKGEDWGFVNAKGEAFCKDAFKNQPTVVIDGLFFVEEGELYSLYQFDKKKPKLLLEGILYIGEPNFGLVPICKKDSRIEIVDTKGVTKFTLDDIEGQEVISCEPKYGKAGFLKVFTTDGDKKYCALIDKKGGVVIKPKYKDIKVISDNLFFVLDDESDDAIFINNNGEVQKQWRKGLTLCSATSEEYVCAKNDDRCYIYNLKGDEILKCPERVSNIELIQGDYFVFNGDGGYGVMDLKGERVLSDKFDMIQILEDGKYLAKRDDKFEIINKKGETIKSTNDLRAYYIEGFGILGSEGYRVYNIVNDDLENFSKNEFYTVDFRRAEDLQSDFFDYGTIINTIKAAIEKGLADKNITFGNNLLNINAITEKGVEAYTSYSHKATVPLVKANKYSISVFVGFNDKVLSPIYKEKKVQHYDYWYGNYTTTQKVVDGYKFNEKAVVDRYEIDCSVPYEKRDNMKKELVSMLNSLGKATDSSKKNYLINGALYSVVGLSISAKPSKESFQTVEGSDIDIEQEKKQLEKELEEEKKQMEKELMEEE